MKNLRKALLLFLTVCVCFLCTVSLAEEQTVQVIILSEENVTILKGKTVTIKPVTEPESGKNKSLEWTSSDEAVATVKNGVIRGVKNGTCDIVCAAKDGGGASAVCHVEVRTPVQSVLLSEKQLKLTAGGEKEAKVRLTASVKPADASWQDVTWSSSDENIATVSADGEITAVSKGQAVITAMSSEPDNNKKATCMVNVGQAVTGIAFEDQTITVGAGKTVALKPEILPKDAANKKLTWSSSDETVVQVNANGAVKGIGEGDAIVTAEAQDGSGAKATIRVHGVVPVKRIDSGVKGAVWLPVGMSRKLEAVIYPENASVKDLIWESSDTKVATVDEEGNVTGVKRGTARIIATSTDGSKVKATVVFHVEKFDVIFTDSRPKQVEYQMGAGLYTVKSRVKAGKVKVSGITKGSILAIGGSFTEHCTVTPVKPGTDMIVISAGTETNYIRVYVSPDAFTKE